MSQKVFRYKAIEAHTKWEIWYDIIPYIPLFADGHRLEAPEIVLLPMSFVAKDTMKLNCGFDKYPLGMLSAEVLKPTLNLSLIVGQARYTECVNALRRPMHSYGSLVVGTIHRVSRYNGADAKVIFEGIQRNHASKDDLINNVMELEIQCARKVILEQLSLDMTINSYLLANHPDEVGSEIRFSPYIFEKIHSAMTYPAVYLSWSEEFGDNLKFMFARYDSFLSYIRGHYSIWLHIALRLEIEEVSVWDFDIVKYYKQVDMSASLGDYLPHYTPSRHLLVGVLEESVEEYDNFVLGEVNEKNVGGLFNIKDKGGLTDKWTNQWDFLQDFYEGNLCKCVPSYDRTKIYTMGFMKTSPEGTYTSVTIPKHKLLSVILDDEIRAVSVVTASNNESGSDDISDYEAGKPDSRNGEEFALQMTFNNIPRVNFKSQSYYEHVDYWAPNLGYMAPYFVAQAKNVDSVHFMNIYYVHQAGSLFRYARVHEYCDVEISESVSVSDLIPFEPVSEVSSLIEIQVDSTKPKIFADALLKVLGNPLLRQMKIKLRFDAESDMLYYKESFYTDFIIDMNEIGDGLSAFGNSWIATEAECDLESGTSEITLINRLNMV